MKKIKNISIKMLQLVKVESFAIMLTMFCINSTWAQKKTSTKSNNVMSDVTSNASSLSITQKTEMKTRWINDNKDEYIQMGGKIDYMSPEFKSQSEKDSWLAEQRIAVGTTKFKNPIAVSKVEERRNFINEQINKMDADFEIINYDDFQQLSETKKNILKGQPSKYLILPEKYSPEKYNNKLN